MLHVEGKGVIGDWIAGTWEGGYCKAQITGSGWEVRTERRLGGARKREWRRRRAVPFEAEGRSPTRARRRTRADEAHTPAVDGRRAGR